MSDPSAYRALAVPHERHFAARALPDDPERIQVFIDVEVPATAIRPASYFIAHDIQIRPIQLFEVQDEKDGLVLSRDEALALRDALTKALA